NCCFFSNTAQGVLVSAASPAATTLTHMTIDSNGAFGVRNSGTGSVAMYNCIVAHNAWAGVYRDAGAGALTTDTSDVPLNAVPDYANAPPGPGSTNNAPKLLAVGSASLLAGSPCINTANPAHCPGTDMFGNPRPIGSGCDIGAFEYGACAPPGISQQP